ncbi:hypothetical protein Slin14017_G034030 [Septoria linicola]|nr:hypothetical protein Slin14017_G034030 [Septoria linicola]
MDADVEKIENVPRQKSKFWSWLTSDIDRDQHWLELGLTALALQTGIVDACTFPKFHCCNTVLFAGTAFSLFGTRQETNFTVPAAHIGTSLAFFCIGTFVAGQIANRLQCKSSRLWLLITNLVGTIMVFIAASLNYLNPTGRYDGDAINSASIICSIGLQAFSAGAQVAMSRQLGKPEIPTTQATAAYVDLFVDDRFFTPIKDNRSRESKDYLSGYAVCWKFYWCSGVSLC